MIMPSLISTAQPTGNWPPKPIEKTLKASPHYLYGAKYVPEGYAIYIFIGKVYHSAKGRYNAISTMIVLGFGMPSRFTAYNAMV